MLILRLILLASAIYHSVKYFSFWNKAWYCRELIEGRIAEYSRVGEYTQFDTLFTWIPVYEYMVDGIFYRDTYGFDKDVKAKEMPESGGEIKLYYQKGKPENFIPQSRARYLQFNVIVMIAVVVLFISVLGR